jgi:hypothetical protein
LPGRKKIMVDKFICPHCFINNGKIKIVCKKRSRGTFKTQDNLKKHIKKTHLSEYSTTKTKKQNSISTTKYKCTSTKCGFKFETFNELFDHIQTNHPELYGVKLIANTQNNHYNFKSIDCEKTLQISISEITS